MKIPIDNTVVLLKALADPSRLKIIEFLMDGEKGPSEIIDELGKSQSTVSQHLKVLVGEEILSVRQEGSKKYYMIRDNQVTNVVIAIINYVSTRNLEKIDDTTSRNISDVLS